MPMFSGLFKKMAENNNEKRRVDEASHDKGSLIKIRHVQVALLFFLILIMFLLRTCLSVAIVAMTTNNTSSNPNIPTYDWDNKNTILSSFFWSYALPQFGAGKLAHMFGTKWLLFTSMFMNSLASVLIPVAANFFGSNGVMSCRLTQGLFQSLLLPLLNGVLGRWVPPQEISFINTIVYAGNSIGVILSSILTGYISASSWGWPATFYIFGIVGFIWCIIWALLSAERPATHKTISMKERKYIEESLGQEDDHLIDRNSVPWKAIFKSLPFWAVMVASIGESWGSTFMGSELPSYFSHAVGLNIEDSGLFSAVPIAAALIAGLCYGPLADFLINTGYTSKVNSRRMFHGLGAYSAALGLVLLPYIKDKMTIVIVQIVTACASAGIILGHFVNQIDISPRYVGILCGISNGTGQLIGMFAPFLVDFFVTDETSTTMWRYMFILAAIICTITATFFIIFCSGERQWWDNVDQDKLKSDNLNTLPSNQHTNLGFEKDC